MTMNLCIVTYLGTPGLPVNVFDFPTPEARTAFAGAVNARAGLKPLYDEAAVSAKVLTSTKEAEKESPRSDLTKFRNPWRGVWVNDLALILGGHIALMRS